MSSEGGELSPVTHLDHKRGDLYHAWPVFLPDGKHFLFLSFGAGRDSTRLAVGTLGSQETHYLARIQTRFEYAEPGYILYGSEGTLMARPFSASGLRFTGEPFPIADHVESASDLVQFSTSASGAVAYMPSASGERSALIWLDRTGKEAGHAGPSGLYRDLALSPDGTRLAYSAVDPVQRTTDLWVWDFRREVASKLSFDTETNEIWPTWSPDGSRVAYAADRKGPYSVYVVSSAGSGEPRLLYQSGGPSGPSDWSRDGHTLLIADFETGIRETVRWVSG